MSTATTLLVKGADLAGAGAADLLVRDGVVAEVGSVSAPRRRRGHRRRRPGRAARPGRPAHPPARAGPRGRRDDRHRRGRRGRRRLHRGPGHGQHHPGHRHRRGGRADRSSSARATGLVDVQPVGAVTKGLAGEELAELGLMARSRARVRVFSDDGHCVARRARDAPGAGVRQGLRRRHLPARPGPAPGRPRRPAATRASSPAGSACPAGPASPRRSIVARDVMLAAPHRLAGARRPRLHRRLGRGDPLGQGQGIAVTAEVTPHHLLLTTDLLAGYDPIFKVNPPLRPAEDVEALRAALADGTIDAVATDHAPHARHDKEHAFVDAAFGMLGLETALSVVSEVMVALRSARLGRRRPGDVGAPGADRRAGRARPPAGGRRAGQPHPRRPARRRSPSTATPRCPSRATTPGTAGPCAAPSTPRSCGVGPPS